MLDVYFLARLIGYGLPLGVLAIIILADWLLWDQQIEITEIYLEGRKQTIKTIRNPKPMKRYLAVLICIVLLYLLLIIYGS